MKMVRKKYYIDPLKYQKKLRPVLVSKGESLRLPISSIEGIEVYRLRTGESIVYDGKSSVVIGANTENTINRTKSRLEKLTKGEIKLTEISNGR